MNDYLILTGADVPAEQLAAFLREIYPPAKSTFLINHGEWLYRSKENQWVVVGDGEIIAYCGIIPAACSLSGQKKTGLWWVDLFVLPKYRGRGIQTLIDQKMRAAADLKLGFPNALAARIHRKHKWGVREDGHILLLPFEPVRVNAVVRGEGVRGLFMKAAAALLTPAMKALSWRYRRYVPRNARRLQDVDSQFIAGIFEDRENGEIITTYRDHEYVEWRFLAAPYAANLAFYTSGPVEKPKICLVARYLERTNGLVVRMLDIFGNMTDETGIRDIVSLAVRDAAQAGAVQVTAMSFLPSLTSLLRRQGFIFSDTGRFCWHSEASEIMAAFAGLQHWALADSDNDEPA